jgi:PAS domain S-box-containing protein
MSLKASTGPEVVRPDCGEDAALAAIIRSSHDAVIAKTLSGIVTSWNLGATKVYGYEAEEMLGQSIEVMIPLEAMAEEQTRHAGVAHGNAESGYRCVRVHADGTDVAVVMSMSPVRDMRGQIIGVASISRPVSDAESTVARFASLLELAPDAMVCADATGKIVQVNTQASALFGYSRTELIGAQVEMLLPPAARDRHIGDREGFFRNPGPRAMGLGLMLRGLRRDGSTFPVEISLATDVDDGERFAIAAVRDVSQQRATEAWLRESETRLLQLAEHVETVFTLSQISPFAYLYISPSVRKLTGLGAEEFVAYPEMARALVHPEDRERVDEESRIASRTGGNLRSEHRILRADGVVRWVRVFGATVFDEAGVAERVVTTTEDVTERVEAAASLREAEEAARAASEAKNEFLSRMSHELRTPLNAVLGFGQLLEHHLGDGDQAESVQHVLRAGRHLLGLINEVLDISRIEAGKISISLEPVSVATLVDEASLLMKPLADAVGIAVIISGGPSGQYVRADCQRLRQILLNLISNAVKYGRRGGHVWLSWSTNRGQTSIDVRDDGPGISSDLHDRMFKPFDRLGAEASSVEGTGVGLTVSRGLAELMDGTITFDSATGAGSTFTITLPSSQEPTAHIPVEASKTVLPLRLIPSQITQGHTVIYIEDNEPNVKVMESVLQLRPGWQLIHAGLARLGLELIRAHQPDLVLLDLHLPDGSGAEVLAALKGDEATMHIPIVVLSADASQQHVNRLLAAGAAQYLTKPFDLVEVLALLDAVAERCIMVASS